MCTDNWRVVGYRKTYPSDIRSLRSWGKQGFSFSSAWSINSFHKHLLHAFLCQVLYWSLGIQRQPDQSPCPQGAHSLVGEADIKQIVTLPYSEGCGNLARAYWHEWSGKDGCPWHWGQKNCTRTKEILFFPETFWWDYFVTCLCLMILGKQLEAGLRAPWH